MSHSRFALGFTRHRKVHRLSDAAFRLWVTAVDYATEQTTNGRITTHDLDVLPGSSRKRDELVAELVALGLWEVTSDGWQIHDFLDWQDSADVVERRRESARERMREVRSHVRKNNREQEPSGTPSEVPDGPSFLSSGVDGSGSSPDHSEPSGSKDPKASPRVAEKAISSQVFDAWRAETGHSRAVLDAKRERRIASRVREGFTAERMILAIKNRVNDPFLMGQNDTGTVYDGIDTLLRDAAQVERLERLTEPRPVPQRRGQQGPKQPNAGAWKPPVES